MNKQEVIEKIEELKVNEEENEYCGYSLLAYVDGFVDARDLGADIIKQLDEPEKVVLTKEEAEWVDKLNEFFDLPEALYYITRCGHDYVFTFDFWGDTYELPIDNDATYEEVRNIKERLMNAVIYGYEVKKEKRYTVELPNPNSSGYSKIYLAKNEDGKVELFTWSCYTSIEYADDWKKEENAQLTESEIKKDHEWAWQFAEEVKE